MARTSEKAKMLLQGLDNLAQMDENSAETEKKAPTSVDNKKNDETPTTTKKTRSKAQNKPDKEDTKINRLLVGEKEVEKRSGARLQCYLKPSLKQKMKRIIEDKKYPAVNSEGDLIEILLEDLFSEIYPED